MTVEQAKALLDKLVEVLGALSIDGGDMRVNQFPDNKDFDLYFRQYSPSGGGMSIYAYSLRGETLYVSKEFDTPELKGIVESFGVSYNVVESESFNPYTI